MFDEFGHNEEAIAAYEDMFASFDIACGRPDARNGRKSAQQQGRQRSAELGRSREAIEAYDEMLARFGAAAEPALREQVARALVKQRGCAS